MPDDTDRPVRFDEPGGARPRRQRQILYGTLTTVVSLVVLAAVVEAVVGLPVYGTDTDTVRHANGPTALTVHFPRVTRSRLNADLELVVSRAGGFDTPLVVSMSADYLARFDASGPSPTPTSETATDSELLMTFDPPPGETLEVRWDLSAEPVTYFVSAAAAVSVLDDAGRSTVTVPFTTEIRP